MYADEITAAPDTPPENGAVVDVLSRKGRYLGSGLLSEASKIRVRLLGRNANDRFDESFWRRRVEYAWAYRKAIYPAEDLQCCRVVFGEADSLPGVKRIHLLPYHRLGQDKYEGLGREYLMKDILPPSAEHMEDLKRVVEQVSGLECHIGG